MVGSPRLRAYLGGLVLLVAGCDDDAAPSSDGGVDAAGSTDAVLADVAVDAATDIDAAADVATVDVDATTTDGDAAAPAVDGAVDHASGSPGQLAWKPTQLAFEPVAIGCQTTPREAVLTNQGASEVSMLGLRLDADTGGLGFNSRCPPALGAGGSCTVSVFSKGILIGGRRKDTLIAVGAGTEAAVLQLEGGGGLGSLTLMVTPGANDFGEATLGRRGKTATFKVGTVAPCPNSHLLLSIEGAGAGQFLLENNHCNGLALEEGVSCTADVTFVPTTAGLASAALIAHGGGTSIADLRGVGR